MPVVHTRRVVFGRINRRRPDEPTLSSQTFAEDMRALADSHLTRAAMKTNKRDEERIWIAADMTLDASGDFMTGVLGYSIEDVVRTFDQESWSWAKGETEPTEGASSDTTVPFAVDLREGYRWVAFATSGRIRNNNFRIGFQGVLNEAVTQLGLWPTDWEFDLLLSRGRVEEWIREHPAVYKLVRTLKFSNPGRDLDADRAEMRALRAARLTEEYRAPYNGTLNTDSEEFAEKLTGIDSGDARIQLEARGDRTRAIFKSDDEADHVFVEEFGSDLQRGMELVLAALVEYARGRSEGGRSQSG